MDAPYESVRPEPGPRAVRWSRRRFGAIAAVLVLAGAADASVARGGDDGTGVETTDGESALPGADVPAELLTVIGGDPAKAIRAAAKAAQKSVSATADKPTTTTTTAAPRSSSRSTSSRSNATRGSSGTAGGDGPAAGGEDNPPPTTTKPPSSGGTPAPTSGWVPTGPAYVVAPGGDDGNPGTEAAPWRTIGHGISQLQPGDNLLVRDGTYGTVGNGQAINIQNMSGSAGAPITIAAYPGEHPKLVGGGWQVVRVYQANYIDIRGFNVEGTAATDQQGTSGIEVRDAHHVRVIANSVHDVGGGGITAVEANHLTIDSNYVWNTSKWSQLQTSGISVFQAQNIGGGNNGDGYSYYIRNNVVHNVTNLVIDPNYGKVTDGNCIIVDSNRDRGYSGATLVASNLCYDNGGRGVHVFISDNVTVVNNTLVRNIRHNDLADQGELSASISSNVLFRNNLVVPYRDGRGVREWQASGISYDHNVYSGSAPERTGPGDIVVADALVGANFQPQADSPAVNAGDADRAPARDIRGRGRIDAPDAGAYEVG
jgi:parallel beta-helix repeat protein